MKDVYIEINLVFTMSYFIHQQLK